MTLLKSQINPMPQFFETYIHPVKEENLIIALEESLKEFEIYDFDKLEKIGDKVYASGKWTVKEILQHIIDNEKIQHYRALRIARNDTTVLPGYDEELLAKNSNANARTIQELKEEFILLRRLSIMFYKSINTEAANRLGVCYKVEISSLALGFVLVGHQRHHLNIIEERYFSLI